MPGVRGGGGVRMSGPTIGSERRMKVTGYVPCYEGGRAPESVLVGLVDLATGETDVIRYTRGKEAAASSRTYVVYKGDDVVAIGSLSEVAERLGVTEGHIRWLASPTAHRKAAASKRGRMVAEVVDQDEIDVGASMKGKEI